MKIINNIIIILRDSLYVNINIFIDRKYPYSETIFLIISSP